MNQIKQRAFEVWLQYLLVRLRRANRDRFFGNLTVEFQRGEVVRIEVTESIKDPLTDSVASDPPPPVG